MIKVEAQCNYCGDTSCQIVFSRVDLEDLKCRRCDDPNLTIRDLGSKIDYYSEEVQVDTKKGNRNE